MRELIQEVGEAKRLLMCVEVSVPNNDLSSLPPPFFITYWL